MNRHILCILTTLVLFFIPATQAALQLELTQGISSAQPIAIIPFEGQSDAAPSGTLTQVIATDLQNSGRFKVQFANSPREAKGADSLVTGRIRPLSGDRYEVHAQLFDQFKSNAVLWEDRFVIPASEFRHLAHHISDKIYLMLIGQRGIFSTKIAYVLEQRHVQPIRYLLEVADADGFNPRPLLTSYEPIMSPAWSKDGKHIAYVSFENKRAQIYVAEVASGIRHLVSSFPGINGAPTWSPDNRRLAIVLSHQTQPKIYTLTLGTKQLQQLTYGTGIDTEPNWSPDGRTILFTSNRGGSPQIYKITLGTGQVERITFKGSYNARASYLPDGKQIVMLHQEAGMFDIAIQDLATGTVRILTHSGRNESPSIAPNGAMAIFSSEYGILNLVSTDGGITLRLPASEGRVSDPAWSPFLGA